MANRLLSIVQNNKPLCKSACTTAKSIRDDSFEFILSKATQKVQKSPLPACRRQWLLRLSCGDNRQEGRCGPCWQIGQNSLLNHFRIPYGLYGPPQRSIGHFHLNPKTQNLCTWPGDTLARLLPLSLHERVIRPSRYFDLFVEQVLMRWGKGEIQWQPVQADVLPVPFAAEREESHASACCLRGEGDWMDLLAHDAEGR